MNCALILLFPIIMVFIIEIHPVSSSIVCTMYSILFLKLISYHMVNLWCRSAITASKRGVSRIRRSYSGDFNSNKLNGHAAQSLVQYPDNLKIGDIYYFVFAPTLCYELNFPRAQRIRKRFLIKRLIEMVCHTFIII